MQTTKSATPETTKANGNGNGNAPDLFSTPDAPRYTADNAPVTERAVLVSLNISAFGGTMKDYLATREIHERYGIKDRYVGDAGAYRKKILQPAVKRINKPINKARNRHYELTLPWSRQGLALLPNAMVLTYTQEMNGFFDEIDAAIRKELGRYEELIERDRRKLNGLFRPQDYPSKSEFPGLYSYGFQVYPIATGNALWSQWEADAMNDEIDRMREEMRSKLDVEMNREIERAMREVWQRAYDAVSKMADKLDAYGTDADGRTTGIFRNSLVDNVRELVDLLPKMNVTGDAGLDRIAERMKKDLTKYDADVLRESDGQRQDVARKAKDIADEMSAFMGA
jgi:hypothetical protein